MTVSDTTPPVTTLTSLTNTLSNTVRLTSLERRRRTDITLYNPGELTVSCLTCNQGEAQLPLPGPVT